MNHTYLPSQQYKEDMQKKLTYQMQPQADHRDYLDL
jgi:hypothetical protein